MYKIFLDIETTGLSPLEKQVTCICAKSENSNFKESNQDESLLLTNFKEYLLKHSIEENEFITKNGKMFDIPFLLIRATLNNLDYKFIIDYNHFDLQDITSKRVSLDDMATLYGVKNKSASGLQAIDWFYKGKYEEIEDYCWQDVLTTEEVYKKWRELHVQPKSKL